jgi:hypothetical protein
VTAFFIPGLTGQSRLVEDAYVEMRSTVELETGRRPSGRRIMQLSSRRGGADCLTEVGSPDPVFGGTVMAIFDLGPHDPFVVCRQPAFGSANGIREVLGRHAYSVLEFES